MKDGLVCILLTVMVFCSLSYAANVISWQDAANYYGQNKTVEGTIVATPNTGKVCFLNFHENWKIILLLLLYLHLISEGFLKIRKII